jgi:anhydro-N-acetylmuramic acid kinase
MTQGSYYVGLMSGTSADAIDAALVECAPTPHLIASHSRSLPAETRHQIHALCAEGTNEIDRMGNLDIELGQLFAKTVKELLETSGTTPADVIAIGSHGQTIRHRPPGSAYGLKNPFSLQIADPNTIAQLTGITTVADFRRRDLAAGGQGAPLVPAFHRAVFHSASQDRVVINLGGMANITWLPKSGEVGGFDTGPGNVLLDGWIHKQRGIPFDANGAWASSGKVHQALLTELLRHPFFALTPPKSTGREDFHLDWLESHLDKLSPIIAPEDIQATLLQLTSQSIADQICKLSSTSRELIVCGGGAYNQALLAVLQSALPNDKVVSSKDFGIAPEWIEAMAFAWLAEQTLAHKPGNLRAVTGACQEVILGGVYYA